MKLFDYIEWRGDLTFSQCKMTAVDALIFCQLSYLNFGGIVASDFDSKKSLQQAALEFKSDDFEHRSDLGLMINPLTVELLFKCADSVRFKNVKLCGFRDKCSQINEEQFAALSFYADEGMDSSFVFAAFRGTDDTIVGWKEDFNLAFLEHLPAQTDALSYLNQVSMKFTDCAVICGGHSKGGNLSLYAGANLKNQEQLKAVYNFDGPGFLKETLETPEYSKVLKKTYSYFPQGSIVGMLFEHDSKYFVVKSDGILVMQHDPFTWFVKALDFELCNELDNSSIYFNRTFNEWYVNMQPEKREEFVETLFDALEATKAVTNSELADNWIKNGPVIIGAFAKMDREIRLSAMATAQQFVKLAAKNIPELIKNK